MATVFRLKKTLAKILHFLVSSAQYTMSLPVNLLQRHIDRAEKTCTEAVMMCIES